MTIQKDTLAFIVAFFILVGNFVLSLTSFVFGENGGNNVPALALITFATLLLFFIVARIEPTKTWKSVPAWFLCIIGVFVICIISSLAVSYDTYITIFEIIRWIICLVGFFITANLIYKTGALSKMANTIILAADFLVIMGIASFVNSTNPGYIRFVSVLVEHNAFAGFLLLPICIAFVMFKNETKKIQKYFYALSATLIGGALILTFSRGAWLSLLLALVIGYFFLKFSKPTKKTLSANSIPLLIILVCIGVFTGGLYKIAVYNALKQDIAVGIYNGDAIPDAATFARLTYFKDALNIIKNNPLGVGLGNYADIAQITRGHIENFAFDPHNLYLKLTAETGVIGGLAFLSFAIGLLFLLFKQNKSNSSNLSKAFVIGIIAILIHNAIDFDFTFTTNLCLFFLVSGAVYGNNLMPFSEKTQKMPLYIKSVFVILVLLSILIIPVYMANNLSLDAGYFESINKHDVAIPLYQKSIKIFPFSYSSYYGLGQVYYNQSLLATGTPRLQLLQVALSELEQAKRYKKASAKIYASESLTYEQLSDIPKATDLLAEAVKLDPLNNLDRHIHLAELYLSQKKYIDVINLVETTVSHYPPQIFSSYIWSDPSKETWRADIITLYQYMAIAYVNVGNKQQAELIIKKIPEYKAAK